MSDYVPQILLISFALILTFILFYRVVFQTCRTGSMPLDLHALMILSSFSPFLEFGVMLSGAFYLFVT